MKTFGRLKFRRQTIWFGLWIGCLAGIGVAKTDISFPVLFVYYFLPVCLLYFYKQNLVTMAAVVLFGVSLGWSRGTVYMQKLAAYQPIEKQKISLTAQANGDAVYGKSKQLTLKANHVVLSNGQTLVGSIQVSGFGVNAVFDGDRVNAIGELYPAHGAVQARMSYAKLSVVSSHPSIVADIRRKFAAGMQSALPEPLAPFAMGLLIGQRSDLPGTVKQDLLKVGLTHIIAVSGYNLTIILHASRRLLGKRSKRLSTLLSFGLIAIFLVLAGSSASIVRAAIVSTLSIVFAYYGREIRPLNLLVLTAAITALANPFYLWSDISWYLSFLTFFGVLVLSPLIQARFPGRWHESVIAGVALESICAEVMSMPYILHIFGQLSLIGLPANVLVTSLVPLAMLLCLIAGLAGMVAGSLAGWLAWPAHILLNYMLDIAHFMANLHGIFIQNRSLSLIAMFGLYGVTIIVICLLYHKTNTART